MMRGPSCPDHGDELLQLALGRLEGDRALTAELRVTECPACSAWWSARFEDRAADVVDAAVREGWAEIALPRRTRRRWLAAAAALLAAAGLTAVLSWPPPAGRTDTQMVSRVFAGSTDRGSDLNRDGRTDASDLALALQRRN